MDENMSRLDLVRKRSYFFGISGLAFLVGISVAQAQTIIDGGQIVTVPGSQASPWNTAAVYIGNAGLGGLTISSGGIVNSTGVSVIGFQSASSGTVTVTGAGAQWNVDDYAVGYSGTGTLVISNGGVVTSQNATIGNSNGSDGTATVTGAGSQMNVTVQGFGIGNFGTGRLIISDGGVVNNQTSVIGAAAVAVGSVTVTGTGSQWNSAGALLVGSSGQGSLTISDGGVASSQSGILGFSSSSSGTVTVTGAGSQWSDSGGLTVGSQGNAKLTIAAGGRVNALSVLLAGSGSSTGTLAIGAETGSAPVAPGILQTASITFGTGAGKLVFNHTASNYVFDASINGGANNATGSGTGLVGGGLVEAIAGRTILNAGHGNFTGSLQVSGSGVLQVNGDMSRASASVLAGGTLEGNGIVGNTVNAGTVSPGGSIGILTVAGNYAGNSGLLLIETVLGNDSSPTDRLIINGDVSGTTTVVVSNRGGSGAQTVDGIQIIRVDGISPANAFTLRGDYVTETGQQAVIAGAYAYTLRHNSETSPTDGNWYLTSEMTPVDPDTGLPSVDPETGLPEEGPRYQAGVPLYEQYPQILASLNTVPTLQQRVGNRSWSNNGAVGKTPGTYGMWGRIEGTRTASDPARSTSHAHRDTDLWKLQTGFDFGLHPSADGALIGGVNISYGKALADIASPYGRGKIDATGTGVGATLTWYGPRGFYVDGQVQVTWFDSDITSTTEGRKDVKGNNGHGYVLSAETGNRYELGNGFFLTPQVQLVYSRVDFNSFTDPFGARVSLNDGDSLRGRFGVSLDHEAQWVAKDGTKSRSHLYGIANLYNEFLDGTKVDVSGVRFATRDERTWAGVGIGGTYEWANGAYAFYGNANIAGSVEHMSDSYAFGGTLGFRARW